MSLIFGASIAVACAIKICVFPKREEKKIVFVGDSRYRSFRNIWLLEELGIEYEEVYVGHIPAKPHSKEAFANHPLGKIPSLRHGDFSMYESSAINTYLADTFRNTIKLTPNVATTLRGRYEQLLNFMVAELDAECLWIHRKHEALPKVIPDRLTSCPEAVKEARRHFTAVIEVLQKELSGDPTYQTSRARLYLLCDEFSALDIFFVHCCNWAQSIGWDFWTNNDDCKILNEYLERCRSRPAYLKAKSLRKENK